MHSTWSNDGKNTLEEMASAAKARGYEYVAITDHAHYLREGRFEAQAKEIAKLQKKLAPFKLLRGVEVSIRVDGTVDFADEDLAKCDWVVASLHSAFDKSPTERILAAMENPHVDCIGHPTARKLNKRGGVDLDIEKVAAKGSRPGRTSRSTPSPTGSTFATHARVVGEAGLPIVISTDSHELGALDFVELGVAQARRAWLTKDQILNSRPWKDIK